MTPTEDTRMPVPKSDKSNVTPLREGESATSPSVPQMPVFDINDDDDGPELQISSGAKAHQESPAVSKTGRDLSEKRKVIFFVGRGKTGKTTAIRWVVERAIANGRVLLMADMDPTNDTFSKFVNGVARPSDPANPALSLKWMERILQHALQSSTSLAIDLGGGDLNLRRAAEQLPNLVSMFEAAEFAVVILYLAGPQEEDLSPLATMMAMEFHPTATAIVLNEAMAEVGDTREASFARVFRHSAFQAALNRGAIPVWMPKLLPAQQVEVRRLPYQDAAAGHTGHGKTPLGPFDRARVQTWLDAMEANFAGVSTWLP